MPHRRPLNVILVEDNMGDAILIRELIERDPRVTFRHVTRLADCVAEHKKAPANVVLLDLNLPDSTGLGTIHACHAAIPLVPVVVLTGTRDDETAGSAIRAGATDYLSKTHLSTEVLARTLRFAIERADAREALAAHKHYLDAVGQSVIVIDAQGVVRYWNEGAARLYGWTAAEAIGRPTRELELTTLSAAERAAMVEEILQGRTWEGEVQGRRKSGETFPVYCVSAPTKSADGAFSGVIGVSHDITRLKRLAQEAKESEARAKSAQRIAGLFSYHVDFRNQTVTWDDEAYAQMRLTAGEFTPTPEAILERIDPTDREAVQRWASTVRDGGRPLDAEYHIRRGDGAMRLVHVLGEATIEDGVVTGFTAVGRDITDQRQREIDAEAARARELERERLAALGTLVAGVAHEINNPLSYMQGNAELAQLNIQELAADDVAREERDEKLQEMHAQLADLLKGIHAIASITKGLKQVARAPNGVRRDEDIAQLVENVIAVARTRVPENIDIHTDLRPDARAHVNAGEISQVLLNLLINAGEALGTRSGHVSVKLHHKEDVLQVEVTDDGPGIPKGVAARLFTPFFTTKAEGTGLGLSVSRRIVEDHGGALTFVSPRGGGATFRLTLPAKAHVPGKAKRAAAPPARRA
ncbi:MAG TPA: ATP-binding protein [Candidatus Thermoplasmatota archaeon]|nr:ATP-binding protein [Candidatus Thermoplasmatota archaeon]